MQLCKTSEFQGGLNPPQYATALMWITLEHLVYSGIEPKPPGYETSNWPPQLLHGFGTGAVSTKICNIVTFKLLSVQASYAEELQPTVLGLDDYAIFQNENVVIPYNLHLLVCNDQLADTELHFRGTTLLQNVSDHLTAEMAHTRRLEV